MISLSYPLTQTNIPLTPFTLLPFLLFFFRAYGGIGGVETDASCVTNSWDVWRRFGRITSGRANLFVVPQAHGMLAANGKNRLYEYMFDAGQPIQDKIAEILVS
jgi:hypothetical protein